MKAHDEILRLKPGLREPASVMVQGYGDYLLFYMAAPRRLASNHSILPCLTGALLVLLGFATFYGIIK